MNLIVRACNDVTAHGGGGDRHLVDLATLQVVNRAGVGRWVAGHSASIGADGPGGVAVGAGGLRPAYIHHFGVTLYLSSNIIWEAGSYGTENNLQCHFYSC